MNFKQYYINSNKYSITLLYSTKSYHLSFESIWNNLMHFLTLFTTQRYTIIEEYHEQKFFVIYYKYYFTTKQIEIWSNKESATKRLKELNLEMMNKKNSKLESKRIYKEIVKQCNK